MKPSPPAPSFVLQNSNPISFVTFSVAHSNLLFSGSREGDFIIYDLEKRRAIFSAVLDKKEPILSILELDSNNVLVQGKNGFITLFTSNQDDKWDNSNIFHQDNYTFCKFELTKDKAVLLLPSTRESSIDLIDIQTRTKEATVSSSFFQQGDKRGMLMALKSCDIEPKSTIMAAFENGQLSCFDLNHQKELSNLELFDGQPLMCFDYSSAINLGISGSSTNELTSFTLNDTQLSLQKKIEMTNPGVNCIKFRGSDSKIFACGCWDSRIRVYSSKKLQLLVVLDFHREAVNTIDFSIHNNLMAAGSSDGIISFWNLYNKD